MVPLSPLSLGSLNLCDSSFEHNHKHFSDFTGKLVSHENQISKNGFDHKKKSNFELQEKLKEAKAWSNMINKKIPKIVSKATILTDEPETINTWEMMDGLEDVHSPPNHIKSFSFNIGRRNDDLQRSNGNDLKPLWLDQTDEEKLDDSSFSFEDFDPEIISSFRKSLQELPSDHPFHFSVHDLEEKDKETIEKDKIILYFTSLRGIRKTYEESCHVRIILKSLGVKVDERDVSMHSGFKDEMKKLLGDELNDGVGITLPRVFLGRKYIGGGEEIRKLNEDGKLEKLLEGCERVEENGNGNGNECEGCGDVRFVPCERCSGSCKVYNEEEKEQTCPDCNENGLIRCPLCSH